MIRLREIGAIDPERFEQGVATLAETAFVKLYVDQNASVSVAGEAEKLSLEILNLKAEQHIKSRRK